MSDLRRLISPTAATLLRAADYIEEHGWCQGESVKPDGSVCIYGALYAVTRDDVAASYDADIALRHRLKTLPEYWNDAPGRTKAEVLKAMRGAAMANSGTP